jgi:hypothetical protein
MANTGPAGRAPQTRWRYRLPLRRYASHAPRQPARAQGARTALNAAIRQLSDEECRIAFRPCSDRVDDHAHVTENAGGVAKVHALSSVIWASRTQGGMLRA